MGTTVQGAADGKNEDASNLITEGKDKRPGAAGNWEIRSERSRGKVGYIKDDTTENAQGDMYFKLIKAAKKGGGSRGAILL